MTRRPRDTTPPDPEPPADDPRPDALGAHAFAPRDIRSVVDEYLTAAHAAGLGTVRLVHGRGRGVQRASIHHLLATHPLVASWRDDTDAHLGATWCTLRG
jgi:DNA-nicking Smr family endonuclease